MIGNGLGVGLGKTPGSAIEQDTMSIKVEIITRETIKPSSPTPHHLRNFELSIFDQLALIGYFPLILFYPHDDNGDHTLNYIERSKCLKESLSKTLTYFYPLAGRIKDNYWIDCNDNGVEYLEARVNHRLSDILESPDTSILSTFLPIEIESMEAGTGRLLLVQSSFFECGGMAIGICISHKIADVATLSTFIKGWVSVVHKSNEVVRPEFNGASLFPPIDSSITISANELTASNCVTKRYVFDASKIALLKNKVASPNVQQPTRVEAVSALIWKCAMTASRSTLGIKKPSLLIQAVNLRKRVLPPLPDNSFGNFAGYFAVQTEESEIELHGSVNQLRKGLENFCDSYAKKLLGNDGASMIYESSKNEVNMLMRDDTTLYMFSSWCKFSFYEADFGWGKPTWSSYSGSKVKNVVVFMDTKDGGGIEAMVSLSEEDMALFERDEELLQFASVNPSVLD